MKAALIDWRKAGQRVLPILAVGLLGAFTRCDATNPFPNTPATFTLRLTGALDTLAADGLGRWTDFPKASNGSASHQLVLWADPAPGSLTAPRVLLGLTREATAPALATGIELGNGDGLRFHGALSLGCPRDDAGGRCAAFLQTSDGDPLPSLVLTRVEGDTIAGRAQFAVVGRLPGTQSSAGAPPDTVAVLVDFTVARNPR